MLFHYFENYSDILNIIPLFQNLLTEAITSARERALLFRCFSVSFFSMLLAFPSRALQSIQTDFEHFPQVEKEFSKLIAFWRESINHVSRDLVFLTMNGISAFINNYEPKWWVSLLYIVRYILWRLLSINKLMPQYRCPSILLDKLWIYHYNASSLNTIPPLFVQRFLLYENSALFPTARYKYPLIWRNFKYTVRSKTLISNYTVLQIILSGKPNGPQNSIS